MYQVFYKKKIILLTDVLEEGKDFKSFPIKDVKLKKVIKFLKTSSAARKKYDDLIVQADKELEDKSYQSAIDTYEKAKQVLPSEIYPNDKIRDIRRILSEIEGKENQYKIFINTADNEFESEKWELALVNYKSALVLFDREYPTNKIAEIWL